jgi:hypothetical protein
VAKRKKASLERKKPLIQRFFFVCDYFRDDVRDCVYVFCVEHSCIETTQQKYAA